MRFAGNYFATEPTYEKYDETEKIIKSLREAGKKATDANLTGFVYRVQIADGYAEYLVTEDKGGERFTIKHINQFGAYQAPAPHIRGLKRADLIREWRWQKAFVR
jgi:hypothetical protein